MCRDCGCSLGPEATRAPFAPPKGVAGKVEASEVITAILGENGRPVEYGEPLFYIKAG